ncbi:MAG UNVERIFIED_CONTAM: hypothetical protein LVR18_26045 [Planctomycetaceae bacterium]
MKILVIGSGGREHALVWKLAQSPQVEKVWCAPGNAGTGLDAENVNIAADDVPRLVRFARDRGIDLTVVGPEAAAGSRTRGRVSPPGAGGVWPVSFRRQAGGQQGFHQETVASCQYPHCRLCGFHAVCRCRTLH